MRNFSFNRKRGFTLLELTIAIVVIAILAAVSVPAISGIVKKSRRSSLEKTLAHVNKEVSLACANNSYNFAQENSNFNFLSKYSVEKSDAEKVDLSLYFHNEKDCYVLVNDSNSIVFPEHLNGAQYLPAQPPNDGSTITTPNHLLWLFNELNKRPQAFNDITIIGDIDMQGLELSVAELSCPLTIRGEPNATISNVNLIHNNSSRGLALFSFANNLTLENLTFDNITVNNSDAQNCAVLVGTLNGTLTLNNITIQNSSVVGKSNVGSLVGFCDSATIALSQITLNNINLRATNNFCGLAVGFWEGIFQPDFSVFSQISVTSCKTSSDDMLFVGNIQEQ